ncbi:proteobacterial dedicated sortase system response regulator [Aliikangiella coralliicola]|uniref:Proteobacterial dedicated sortase system response regulator n=1 Tax=Aliikangiella coralliicola TaxID=2592383 RepID=A0A545U4X2_9GAMM|nr:proteobacterial dedicated sortase system response regulator [Aliikangiella coralliicola]TQV84518.1 proteobacterial dedicated sortase system response regulator [Aliikangiella coralliicola]
MAKRIALVEDEKAIRENYVASLRKQGYEVYSYETKQEALSAFETRLPDLAILDVGLGDEPEGGFELCRYLRAQSATLPIIFLTALDSEFDTISGLRLGADDYLTKDISLTQVLVRISALFRRIDSLKNTQDNADELIEVAALQLDVNRFTASWQSEPLEITLTEFWILHALVKRPGHVKNRDQLMEAAKAIVDDSTVTSHIKRLRKKFVAIDAEFDRIETVYGMGYRWKA